MLRRVLIVEDDDVQQAVLRSALVRRGYEVEVASDGLTAVHMLRAGGFDLALIDYHLPEIDGLASARLLRALMTENEQPKLIAVTVDPEGLSSREMAESVFDAIVSKPLDLPALLTIVDNHLRAAASDETTRAAAVTWLELGLPGAPAAIAIPRPTPAQAQVLRCYFDLGNRREPQAVLLLDPDSVDDVVAARAQSDYFALPFIDLSGGHAAADAAFVADDRTAWGEVASVIGRFGEQRRLIAAGASRAADVDTRLLVYLFLSGRPFSPTLDFASREWVRYPGFFPDGEARLAAERLVDRGLLAQRFFERFHTCGSCGSVRLNAREECPACRSGYLRDVPPHLHHFRCDHRAPEADFISDADFVCPKCREHLGHLGDDYGKPGSATRCGGCGLISSATAVGFVCLDCGAHTDGDAATKRDVFSYVLTPEGVALVQRGSAGSIAATSAALRF